MSPAVLQSTEFGLDDVDIEHKEAESMSGCPSRVLATELEVIDVNNSSLAGRTPTHLCVSKP